MASSILLEKPLRADFALLQAFLADYLGNHLRTNGAQFQSGDGDGRDHRHRRG